VGNSENLLGKALSKVVFFLQRGLQQLLDSQKRPGALAKEKAELEAASNFDDEVVQKVIASTLKCVSLRTSPPESIQRILDERRRMQADRTVLADGSLGEPGPFDVGKLAQDAYKVSKPHTAALQLYQLVRELKPKTILEIGTNVGVSSAYLSAALNDAGVDGRIITLDASPYRLREAEKLHKNLGFTNIEYRQGYFEDTLDDAIVELGSIDIAFIDGNHHYEPTIEYTNKILPCANDGAVLVYDDIRWFRDPGMLKAWNEIERDERFVATVDLESVGLAVHRKQPVPRDKRLIVPRLEFWLK